MGSHTIAPSRKSIVVAVLLLLLASSFAAATPAKADETCVGHGEEIPGTGTGGGASVCAGETNGNTYVCGSAVAYTGDYAVEEFGCLTPEISYEENGGLVVCVAVNWGPPRCVIVPIHK